MTMIRPNKDRHRRHVPIHYRDCSLNLRYLIKGEGGVCKGQKSHNPVGGPSFQLFKAFMEI